MDTLLRGAIEKLAFPRFNLHCQAPPVTGDKLTEWESLLKWRDEWPIIERLIALVRDAESGEFPVDVPTKDERADWGILFDAYQEPYRTPAFHLLWCANELSLGRMPTFE